MSASAEERIVTAAEGVGPLLQRDYRAVLHECVHTPQHVLRIIRAGFKYFSPPDLARFFPPADRARPVRAGDQMRIDVKYTGETAVRVVGVDQWTFTLRTLDGHPEAGRITFGAEPAGEHGVLVRIRSRARANGLLNYVGYELVGRDMQTRVWTSFLERLATVCGARLAGDVQVETREVQDAVDDAVDTPAPTFAPRIER